MTKRLTCPKCGKPALERREDRFANYGKGVVVYIHTRGKRGLGGLRYHPETCEIPSATQVTLR